MLRVAGVSWLGTCSSYPPNSMQGRLCWASCWSQQCLALSTPWREHPTGWFQAVQQGKLENQDTRHRSDGWRVLFYVYHKAVVGLILWVGFWRAVRRISLRESHRISCPVVAVSHCARGSLPQPCTSHWRLFPLFVFQVVPWKASFGISVHYWDITSVCDSGLFCSRCCPQDIC